MQVYKKSLTITGALLVATMAHGQATAAYPTALRGSSSSAGLLSTSARAQTRTLPVQVGQQPNAAAKSRVFFAGRDGSVPVMRGGSAGERAQAYVRHFAGNFGLSATELNGAYIAGEHSLRSGGSIVQFAQRIAGVEVFGSRLSVVMDAQGRLVGMSGELFSAGGRHVSARFRLSHDEALSTALRHNLGNFAAFNAPTAENRVSPTGFHSYRVPVMADGTSVVGQAQVRQVYVRSGSALVPAYQAEFIGRAGAGLDNDARLILVSAHNGQVLSDTSLTADDKFKYRVWAEKDGDNVPTDGPLGDYTPHPTGKVEDTIRPEGIAPELIEIEGFNKNPMGAADPWLLPSAVESRGNNVDAYSDRDQYTDANGVAINDGFTNLDWRATLTGEKAFDRVFDLTKEPGDSTDQIMAAVTQLFYVNNWLHDYWYNLGFDEASGNAQQSNFGRGGAENDPLHVQAQDSADGGQRDNANMSTLSDGGSPRMQMYLWNSLDKARTLTADPSIDGFDGSTDVALFGPKSFEVEAEAIVMEDSTDPKTDGCEETMLDLTGKIVIVESGAPDAMTPAVCRGVVRADLAQKKGAVGLIYIAADDNLVKLGNDPALNVTIPGMTLTKSDGDKLIAAIKDGTVTLTMSREAGIEIDGTIDNQIVAHEWGHYIHHRLVQCGSKQCGGMSEGWGDYFALHMTLREGDKTDGVYGIAGYATEALSDAPMYYGIRRYPYSTDMKINPLTFKHIRADSTLPDAKDVPMNPASPDMTEVHNTGEVWTAMLHEAHMNMIDARDWKEGHTRMGDYVVAGMKAAPVEPTWAEQRDGILLVAMAGDEKDFEAIAKGFATRGMGSCAVAPPVTSQDNMEAVESTELQGNLQVPQWAVGEADDSCDQDNVLDVGEEGGGVAVVVVNTGSKTLKATKAKVSTSSSDLEFDGDGMVDLPEIKPYGQETVIVPAKLKSSASGIIETDLKIEVSDKDACVDKLEIAAKIRLNTKVLNATSTKDNAEAENDAWTVMQIAEGVATPLWGRAEIPNDQTTHIYWGQDAGSLADSSFVSPAFEVSDSEDFKLKFMHYYDFEQSDDGTGTIVNWDGALIEYSTDGGKTWADVSDVADPKYNGPIGNIAGSVNPLAGREGFVGKSSDTPLEMAKMELNFKDKLKGKTVHVRFRVASDEVQGALGWVIDDLEASGITNTPFSELVADDGACDDGGTDTGTDTDSTGTDSTGTDTTGTTTGTGTDTQTGNSDGSDTESDSSEDPSSNSQDTGCNCSADGSAGNTWWAALLALPLISRRRRRAS